MKKLPLALLTLTGFACFTVSAADTSQITITANVVASSCTVDTTSLQIDLGNIEASTLLTAGQFSPWSDEKTITLSKCPASTTGVDAVFTGVADTDDTNGYKNTSSGATNVSIELAKPDGVTYLNNNAHYGNVAVSGGNAVFSVKARLFTPKGTALPGAAGAVAQVAFIYK